MARIQSYRDLEVWQRGVDLTVAAYEVSRRLPSTEQYELARQIRRAASSIPANVAEGHERREKGYLNHVRIALGSLSELQTHFEVAIRLGYLNRPDVASFIADADSVGRMLNGLRRSLMRRLMAKAAPIVSLLLIVAMLVR
jgi:four helix bundle protein